MILYVFLSFYIYYLEFFRKENLSFLPHVFIQLFISLWTQWCSFCSVSYNTIIAYFVAQMIPAVGIRSFFGLGSLSLKITILFQVLAYFLAPQSILGSSYMFPAPGLE